MHTFWEAIVSNSLVVTVLAVALVLLGRIWKNPLGLHVLWVMVLLKFVTPPLLILPVPLRGRKYAKQGCRCSGTWVSSKSPEIVSIC
jgi:hypothetical protein